MSECTHDCSSCSANCSSRNKPQDLHEPPHQLSHIKKVIGIVSGKGGVGKSMTSAMLATLMRRRDYAVGVLDADVTGPSIPKLFGIHGRAMADENGYVPEAQVSTGADRYPFTSMPVVENTLTLSEETMTTSGWILDGKDVGLKTRLTAGLLCILSEEPVKQGVILYIKIPGYILSVHGCHPYVLSLPL